MRIIGEQLKKNTQEQFQIGDLTKFKEDSMNINKRDPNNRLNELSIFDWIRHTNSFHYFIKKYPKDELKLIHPATYEEELPYYYIEFFTKPFEVVFDPFSGTGTSQICASVLNRKSLGIEINNQFVEICKKRFSENKIDPLNHIILNGNCLDLLKTGIIDSILKKKEWNIAFTITSPPFFNILRSYTKKKNILKGVTNYGDEQENLELIEDYEIFLNKLKDIFEQIYCLTKERGYLLINTQNFYRKLAYKNGKESQEIVFFAWDLTRKIIETRWIPCAEQIWAYPTKKLFPFGSPYLYLANITHNYNLIFYKDSKKK